MAYINKRYLSILSIIAVLTTLLGIISSTSDEGQQPLITTAVKPTVIKNGVSTQPVLGYTSQYGELTNGFDGTSLDHMVLQDESGNLLITQDLKRVFDFFLSGNATEDPSLIQMRIQEYLAQTLTSDALAKAEMIMRNYLGFKKALTTLGHLPNVSDSKDSLSQLAEQLAAQRALRDQFFSPEVVAVFFGPADKLDDYTLQRLLILSDDTLDAGQKQQTLADLESQRPDKLQKKEAHAERINEIKQQVKQLRVSGADDTQIFQYRTETLGIEAAQRFRELDDQRSLWQKRVDTYLNARQEILNHSGLSTEQKTKQIEAIKNNRFNRKERLRLLAYERR